MQAEDQTTVFSAASSEAGARHRRPGSRRSTSAWTVYAGADLAAPAISPDPENFHRNTNTNKGAHE